MGLLEGKVAVVTGSGRGIGRAVAVALAEEGAAVGLFARTVHEIESVADEIQARGGRAVAVPTDVGRREQVEAFFAQLRESLGEVDILVNNAAGTGAVGMLWETNPEDWLEILNVNVIGMARCAKAVLPAMMARRNGKIINVGSMSGCNDHWAVTCPEQLAYGVSKAAVWRFSSVLARQVIGHGINVNCVGVAAHTRLGDETLAALARLREQPPPPKHDEMPAKERTMPEENVDTFVFLASSLSDHITGAYFEANSLSNRTRRGGH